MEVVGHQAVGAQGEGLLSGNLLERFQEPARDAAGAEIGDAVTCAESEKISATADVVLFWETDGFVKTLVAFEGGSRAALA